MPELVVALDVADAARAKRLAAQLSGTVNWLKIGLELFTGCGPDLVRFLQGSGFKIFLDLKFYDIPNTVGAAVAAAARLGVGMLTLHCQGGERMCSAAVEALAGFPEDARPLLFGVTALTSFAAGEMPGIDMEPGAFGIQLAAQAFHWGLDGVVCSGHEARPIKEQSPGLLCLCPGIRPALDNCDDQRRTMTPATAIAAGADFLVVGRPILRAENPAIAARNILREMARSAHRPQ